MQILGGLGAGLAIVLGFAAWHLSSGPISVGFLTAYIERALNASARGVRVELDDTVLTWAGWERTLDIRAVGLRILSPEGQIIAAVPEMSLSLSARALLSGKIAPRRIELFHPRMRLVRSAKSGLTIGFEGEATGTGAVFQRALDELIAASEDADEQHFLSHLSINNADLTIVDETLGTSWQAPGTQIFLARYPEGIRGEMRLNVVVNEGRTARLKVVGGYRSQSALIEAAFSFSDLVPSEFAALSEKLRDLANLEMPVDGTIALAMALDGTIQGINFDLLGDAGRITIPGALAQTIAVEQAAIRGNFDGTRLVVETLHLEFGEAGDVILPAAAGHRVPIRAASLSGIYDFERKRLDLTDTVANLGGPVAGISATAEGFGSTISVVAHATLQDVPTDQIGRYWPAAWGRDAHTWVTNHLSKGRMVAASADVRLTTDPSGEPTEIRISGELEADGVTVDYLPPMPKVANVTARAVFDETKFHIRGKTGRVFGLKLTDADILISDLHKKDQWADIALTVEGPAQDALRLIDSKPLQFAKSVQLEPARLRGSSRTNVKLKFPLEKNLKVEDVGVAAAAALTDVEIVEVRPGLDLKRARVDLRVDTERLVATGSGDLRTIPARIEWIENFNKKTPFRSRYTLAVDGDVARLGSDLDLSFPPFSDRSASGQVKGTLVYAAGWDRKGVVDIQADLKGVRLDVDTLKWRKEPGVAGAAHVVLNLANDKVTRIAEADVTAGDLAFKGSGDFTADGRLARLEIQRLAYGGTDVQGTAHQGRDGGWTVSLIGPSFDLEPFMDNLFDEDEDTKDATPLGLALDFARVRMGPSRFITQVKGAMARTGSRWRKVTLDGMLETNVPLAVRLEPGGTGRILRVQSNDAGTLLRTLGHYEYMKGGVLQLEGAYDDRLPSGPLKGTLLINDYRIIKAPGFGKLLSVLSLTGIVDALQGEGVGFNVLRAPFTFDKGVLQIADAKATGVSLGYTANGRIFTATDTIDVEGTLVPAYVVNSALGKLPLIGGIFSGGEEGGGVFAEGERQSALRAHARHPPQSLRRVRPLA
jgi:hypothetical protein